MQIALCKLIKTDASCRWKSTDFLVQVINKTNCNAKFFSKNSYGKSLDGEGGFCYGLFGGHGGLQDFSFKFCVFFVFWSK